MSYSFSPFQMYNIVLLMTLRMLYITSSELTYLITGVVYFLTTFTSPGGSDSKLSACSAGDCGSLPGLGRSLESMANHCSILAWRIPMDRGTRWATVHGVAKSQTRLKRLSTHTHTYVMYASC